jgi:hypothetical protein
MKQEKQKESMGEGAKKSFTQTFKTYIQELKNSILNEMANLGTVMPQLSNYKEECDRLFKIMDEIEDGFIDDYWETIKEECDGDFDSYCTDLDGGAIQQLRSNAMAIYRD